MVQTKTEPTVMLIYAMQCFISATGVKCDKMVDFPKSDHICD